jgi:phage protein U
MIAEKSQLEAEGRGEEKAYQVEAKRLLDSVISQNKDEKAVSSFKSENNGRSTSL